MRSQRPLLSSLLLHTYTNHLSSVLLPPFVVKLNELSESEPEKPQEDLVISGPTNARRVPVDWNGSANNSPVMSNSGGPPALPPKNNVVNGPKRAYSAKKIGAVSPAHSRANSASSTGSYGSASSGTPNISGHLRSNSSNTQGMAKSTSTKRPPVFGVSLKVVTSDASGHQLYVVPPIVTDSIEVIRRKGLKEEGIFRIGGSHSTIQQYKARYDSGEKVDLSGEPDVNNVSGLLKMFLRELPEHLFTEELLHQFHNAYTNVDPHASPENDQSNEIVAQLLSQLPETNLAILQQIFALLEDIVKLSNINKMTSHNLGIIFTQCLKIDGTFFQYLMQRPHLLKNARPGISENLPQGDLIQW